MDHDALRWLINLAGFSGRLARGLPSLAELDFTIEYRPGRVHVVLDAVSGLVPTGAAPQTGHDEIPSLNDALLVSCFHATAKSISPPSLTVTGSVEDGVVLVSTGVQRAHTKTDPPPQSSPSCISSAPHRCERARRRLLRGYKRRGPI